MGRHETQCREHVGCEPGSDAATRHELVKMPPSARNKKMHQHVFNLVGVAWATPSRRTMTRFQAQHQLVPYFCHIQSREQFPHLLRWSYSFRSDVS